MSIILVPNTELQTNLPVEPQAEKFSINLEAEAKNISKKAHTMNKLASCQRHRYDPQYLNQWTESTPWIVIDKNYKIISLDKKNSLWQNSTLQHAKSPGGIQDTVDLSQHKKDNTQ